MNPHRRYVIINFLAEDRGHLLLDDAFWFRSLRKVDPATVLISSRESVSRIRREQPAAERDLVDFTEYPLLRRKLYRIALALRLWSMPRVAKSEIVIQGFDEIALLLALPKLLGRGNRIALVLTNNVSTERLTRSPRLLPCLLRISFTIADRVFYHSDYEFQLIREFVRRKPVLSKLAKLKYHLLGVEHPQPARPTQSHTIAFFGPVLPAKPIEPVLALINADRDCRFNFIFYNIGGDAKNQLSALASRRKGISIVNEWQDDQAYLRSIQSARYVFLPHNRLFEGKVSGILSDCIANEIPVISHRIEPVLELSRNYGWIGHLYDYDAEPNWPERFFADATDACHETFRRNMKRIREDHCEDHITAEFVNHFY